MYGAAMEWLNYHHLRYFWEAAREGSVTRAGEKLHISQPAVSTQIRGLEQALGEKLFTRSGRTLALTETGRVVYRYAEEIFGLGTELIETLKGRPTGRPARLVVGIVNVIPKLIAYRLLEPAFKLPERVRVECREDRPERLLAELATHGLDLVLADAPAGASRAHLTARPSFFPRPTRRCPVCWTIGSRRRASAPGSWGSSRTARS